MTQTPGDFQFDFFPLRIVRKPVDYRNQHQLEFFFRQTAFHQAGISVQLLDRHRRIGRTVRGHDQPLAFIKCCCLHAGIFPHFRLSGKWKKKPEVAYFGVWSSAVMRFQDRVNAEQNETPKKSERKKQGDDAIYSAYLIRRDKVAKPLAGYTAPVGGLSGFGSIRVVLASSSSIATRISIRARGAAGQAWIPAP